MKIHRRKIEEQLENESEKEIRPQQYVAVESEL